MTEKIQQKERPFVKYTLAFLMIAAIPVIWFSLNHKSFINLGDAADGFYPGFVYLGNYIRAIPGNLIQYHRIPSYDFLMGIGGNILETIGIAGDPFNWLAVFFPGELSVFGYNFCIFLRLYVGGLGFMLWAGRKKLNRGALFGALLYVFCRYAINTGIHFYNYLTAFAMFPFIAAGVDAVIEERKKYSGLLLLGITVTAMDGFAFLYMDTVFFAFYIPIRAFYNPEKKKYDRKKGKEFWNSFFTCIKHYLLGLGIAAPFFIPDLYGHMLSSRSDIELTGVLMRFSSGEFLDRLKGFISNVFYTDGIGIGALCLVAVLLILFSRKHKDLRWILFFVTVGHFVLGFHVLMNCFLYAPYAVGRWHYILYFCMSMALAVGIEEWTREGVVTQRKRIVLILAVFLCLCLFVLLPALKKGFSDDVKKYSFAATVIVWIIVMLALWIKPERRIAFLTIACIITAGVNAWPVFYSIGDFADSDIYSKTIESKLAIASGEDHEKGALRTDLNDPVRMASLIIGYPGTRSYYSVQNEGYYDFLREMACSASLYGGNVNLGSLDGRKSLEMLLSVGTYSDDLNNTIIHHNDGMILPIGFAFDTYMLNSESLEMDPLDRSHAVLKMVYLEDETNLPVKRLSKNDIGAHYWEAVTRQAGDEKKQAGGVYRTISFPAGSFKKDEETEYYLYIDGIESEDWLSGIRINQVKLLRFTPAGEAANHRGEYLIKLAVDDSVVEKGNIELDTEYGYGAYRLGDMEIRKLDIRGYQEDYEKLAKHALRNVSMTPDRISGEITCDKDSVLFTSILYDSRWTCLIDGKSARIHKADSGFLAAEIEKGEHQIILEYRTPLGWIGWGLFVVAVAFVMLMRKNSKMDAHRKEMNGGTSL